MKKILLFLLFFLAIVPDAHGQLFPRIFRPRDRYPVCPGPDCTPDYNPSHPPLAPSVEPEQPDALIGELDNVIPENLRIRNRQGNCVWCAMEDVFVAAGYDQFKGITERAIRNGWAGATWSNVESAIKDSGVDVVMSKPGQRDTSIFDYARKEGVGVVVFIPGHALVCLHLDDKTAYMIDNNPSDGSGRLKILKWARSKFDKLWEGYACCPRKKKPRPNDKPAVKPEVKPDVKPETKPEIKPVEPPCKCPAPTDQKAVTDALAKLTEVATLTNQSVQGLTVKVEGVDKRVGEIDKRLSVVEKKQAEPPPSQKPPEADPRIGQIQNDLDKLRAALKRGGTLNVTITPQ